MFDLKFNWNQDFKKGSHLMTRFRVVMIEAGGSIRMGVMPMEESLEQQAEEDEDPEIYFRRSLTKDLDRESAQKMADLFNEAFEEVQKKEPQ